MGRLAAILPFEVIQGHRIWYQSKAHFSLDLTAEALSTENTSKLAFVEGVGHFEAKH